MVQSINFKWAQGEDLKIRLLYKEGETLAKAHPVDLSASYALKMDLVIPNSTEVIYSFLSDDFVGTLSNGINKNPNITIVLPRALTLSGGVMYEAMASARSLSLSYDIFLRNTTINQQVKILRGTVIIEGSTTLWP